MSEQGRIEVSPVSVAVEGDVVMRVRHDPAGEYRGMSAPESLRLYLGPRTALTLWGSAAYLEAFLRKALALVEASNEEAKG